MAGSLGVVVAFSAGLFSFLSPCVLPLFPSYLSFITGMSVADLSTDLTAAARRRVLLHAVTFVLGFSVVFVALGASFSAAGQLLFEYRDWIRRIGGLLIIVFGLYIAGFLNVGFLSRTQQYQLREKPAGYVGTFLVGVTFAIGWTPCVGPILGAILSLAGTAESAGSACSSRTRRGSACRSCSRRSRSAPSFASSSATARSFPWSSAAPACCWWPWACSCC